MRTTQSKRALTGAFSLLAPLGSLFAEEISRESFEGPTSPLFSSTGLISSPDQFYDGDSDFWTATDGANPPIHTAEDTSGAPSYNGQDGARYWAGEDLDHVDDGSDTVVFGPIVVSGHNNLRFDGLFASDGLSGGIYRLDAGEGIEVAWSIDGSPFTTALAFKAGPTPGTDGLLPDLDLNGTGDSGQPRLTPAFSSHGFAIPANGGNLRIRVTGIASGSSEEMAFDNLTVSGDPVVTNQAPGVTSISAPDVGEPEIGNTSYSFTVTYSDNSGVAAGSIDANDVTVNGIAMTSGTTSDPTGSPLTATYTFTPPGGSWNTADNGTYTVSVVSGEVGDDAGPQLFVPAGSVGSFTVAANNTPPSVLGVSASDVGASQAGQTSYSFTIDYTDIGGIDVSSIDAGDVTVTGPGGLVVVTGGTEASGSDGAPKTASYSFTPPGGAWDVTDDGTYTIGLVAGEVVDVLGADVPSNAALATFSVDSTCIRQESFEGPAPGYDTGLITALDQFYSGTSDFFTVTDGATPPIHTAEDVAGSPSYNGQKGARYWAGEDLDHLDDNIDSVDFGPIPVSGINNLSFSALFAADGFSGGTHRYDNGEGIEVSWSIDGSPFVVGLAFKSIGPTDSALHKDAGLDGTGDPGEPQLLPAFSSHGFSIPGTGTNLTIRVTAILDGSSEEIAFDALKVNGDQVPDNQAPSVAVVNAPDVGEPEIGETSYSFTVTYSDDSGVDASTIDANDVTVNGIAMDSATAGGPSGSPLVATYSFTPPGGDWDSGDNGTFSVDVVADEVGDNDGTQLFVAAGQAGTFEVAADNSDPEVTAVNAPTVGVLQMGTSSYSFTIEYSDLGGIDVSSIGASDVTVTGPGGPLTVTGGSEGTGSDGSPKTGTYNVTPPGGSWLPADDGLYTIALVGSEVDDVDGASVPANPALATFSVDSTCVAAESFEAAGPGYDTGLISSPDQFYAGDSDFWTVTDGANPPIHTAEDVSGAPSYNGQDGSFYWAGEDLDHQDDNSDTVVFGPLPITGADTLSFSALFAADGFSGGTHRYDPGDGIEVAWSIDGSSFVTALAFKALGPGNDTALHQDTDLSGAGEAVSPQLVPAFASFGFTIPATGDNLTIRITGILGAASEEVAFDNLKVSGNANFLPTVSNLSQGINEDQTVNFGTADFDGGFSDPNPGDILQVLRITSLPSTGKLFDNGAEITTTPTDIARGDIGTLSYVPLANFGGPSAFFGWNASDGTDFAAAGATYTFGITEQNDPPVPGNDTFDRYEGSSLKIPIASLLSNDADPADSPQDLPLSLNSVTASGSGAIVTDDGTTVFYNPNGHTGADTFTYTVMDSRGGISVAGTVTIDIITDNSPTLNLVGNVIDNGDGTATVNAAGIPGRTYRLQGMDTNPGAWTTLATGVADAQGRISLVDPGPLPPTRIYRVVTP